MEDKNENLCHKIASLAMESMLYEVSATPKPGLVDRNNCGAHHDMEYFTFMSSAAALHSCFDTFVRLGFSYRNETLQALLNALRSSGVTAEQRMFDRTGGVNTHKGMIFTLGMVCGAAGWSMEKMPLDFKNISGVVSRMCSGLCERDYAGLEQKKNLTKGEKMFLQYGCTGVRGEVEQGYPAIAKVSLPVYNSLRNADICVNDALVQTLLYLISYTCDTNILSRHDMQTALFAQLCAKNALERGGIFTEDGKNAIETMDNIFIQKYISPGGCADLLAVTHFIWSLERLPRIENCVNALRQENNPVFAEIKR